MRYFVKIWILLFLFGHLVFSSTDFVLNKFGARPVGQGGAYISRANGPEAIFYNWSKQPVLTDDYFKIDAGRYLDIPFYTFGYQNVFNTPNLRFGYLTMGIDDIYETELNDDGQPIDTGKRFSNTAHQLYTSYRHDFYGTDIGIRLGGFLEKLYDSTGRAITVDLGLYRSWRFSSFTYSSGLVYKNLSNASVLWSSGHQDEIPRVLGFGQTFGLFEEKLFLSFDLEKESDWDTPRLYSGFEYWLTGLEKTSPSMAVRGGYKHKDLTLGLGMNLGGMIIDYSYIHPRYSFLDSDHIFSVGYSFHSFKPSYYDQKKLNNINEDTLNYREEKFQKGDVRLLLEAHFKLVDNIQIQYWVETYSGKLQLNKLNVSDADKVVTRFPINLRLFPENSNEVAMISIEKTSGGFMILSGFMPQETQLMVNEIVVPMHSKDHSLFYKLPIDNIDQIDLVIFKNDFRP